MTFFFCTQLCCRWSENALDVNATAKHVSNRNDYESSKFFCKKKKNGSKCSDLGVSDPK